MRLKVSPLTSYGQPSSLPALEAFAHRCDIVTFDHELVDAALLRRLEADGHVLRPGARAMAIGQDKLFQRREAAALGLPVPPFAVARDAEAVAAFAAAYGWPVVLKARRGGYDGRGVWMANTPAEAAAVLVGAAARGRFLLVEQWVRIEREVAVMVARRPSGDHVAYPVVETVQVGGMLKELIAPAPLPERLATAARSLAERLAAAIDLAGVMALELFVSDGRLLVNELAVRPHNSAHHTIEGAVTSQFENHLRAVLDWPLGSTALRAPAVVTVNVVGRDSGDLWARMPAALRVQEVHVHLYAKTARPGRKLGHVTALGATVDEAHARAQRAAQVLMGGDGTKGDGA